MQRPDSKQGQCSKGWSHPAGTLGGRDCPLQVNEAFRERVQVEQKAVEVILWSPREPIPGLAPLLQEGVLCRNTQAP